MTIHTADPNNTVNRLDVPAGQRKRAKVPSQGHGLPNLTISLLRLDGTINIAALRHNARKNRHILKLIGLPSA